MQLHAKFLILFLLSGVEGCWKKASSTPPATTAAAPNQVEVVETVQAKNVKVSEAAKPRSQNDNKPSTSELKKLSEELFQLDEGSVGSLLNLDLQGKSRDENSDDAPRALFSSVPTSALQSQTTALMVKLLDNYEPSVRTKEHDTTNELKEQTAFLDAIMNTDVMKRAENFLQQKKLIKGSLRPQMELIWFTPYSRHRGLVGSSGFEHVFLGELKNGKVSGLHNWVFFQQEEKEGDLNYKGYVKNLDLGNKADVLKLRFTWLNKEKPLGSMFVGTSPELELALYTICFYSRPNANCNLRLGGKNVSIKVYQQHYKGSALVGSAYPIIY